MTLRPPKVEKRHKWAGERYAPRRVLKIMDNAMPRCPYCHIKHQPKDNFCGHCRMPLNDIDLPRNWKKAKTGEGWA